MDASAPVDSRVFMHKRALRKYLADSGLTEVVRPEGRQYTLEQGKVLVEAIVAGIELLEFRCKVENNVRFDLVARDPDALFSINAKQERDQAVNAANDYVRRQTAKRRDARSVAVEGTKPHGSIADGHDSRDSQGCRCESRAEPSAQQHGVLCVRQVRSQAAGLPPKPVGQGGEGRSWPDPRPDPCTTAVPQRSRSAYPEQDSRDGSCDCHSSS